MPKAYEKMRDKFIKEGLSAEKAKEKAAKIYNAARSKNNSLPNLSNKGD